MGLFDVECSLYASAKDRDGIGTISLHEFLFGNRWKAPVEHLRQLVDEYGPIEAKSHPDYKATKLRLPGATLSGLFRRRKGSELIAHTGFIAIDIDLADNTNLGNFEAILRTLRHRTEVAMYMKSCSGTGYFAMVPLAYPDHHKEQFRALQREYAAMGVVIDNACSDITRIRFASYDEHPYVNEDVLPYQGLDLGKQTLAPKAAVYGNRIESNDELINKVERLVRLLEQHQIDITNSYNDWFRIGFSLANLPEPFGRQYFHRVSAICGSKYNPQECDRKFNDLSRPERIGIGTFLTICRDYGVI